MYRRPISRLATLALLAGILLVFASAARVQQPAAHPQVASAHATALAHADGVLASSPAGRPLVRDSIPPARLAASVVVVVSPTLWVQAVACLATFGLALLFTPRRRRAPPRSLFA